MKINVLVKVFATLFVICSIECSVINKEPQGYDPKRSENEPSIAQPKPVNTSRDLTIVILTAQRCSTCQHLKTQMSELQGIAGSQGVAVDEIDSTDQTELMRYGISAQKFPAIFFMEGKNVLKRLEGFMSASDIFREARLAFGLQTT